MNRTRKGKGEKKKKKKRRKKEQAFDVPFSLSRRHSNCQLSLLLLFSWQMLYIRNRHTHKKKKEGKKKEGKKEGYRVGREEQKTSLPHLRADKQGGHGHGQNTSAALHPTQALVLQMLAATAKLKDNEKGFETEDRGNTK
jgi:hypothetical protein